MRRIPPPPSTSPAKVRASCEADFFVPGMCDHLGDPAPLTEESLQAHFEEVRKSMDASIAVESRVCRSFRDLLIGG